MLSSIGNDGGIRGLFVFGSNVAVSAPDARRIQQRLRKLDLLVVSDFLLSETAALADVVRRSDEATSFRRAILATSSTSCGSRARWCSRLQGHLVRTDSQRLTACSALS
jgi:hypothetical protein